MISRWLIDRLEGESGEDMTYMREIARESRAGFWRLALSAPLLRHCRSVPPILMHLARLGALRVEDCGPCVQMQINQALRDRVPAEIIRQALSGADGLPPLERDAYSFGRAVAGDGPVDENVRARLEREIGRSGVVELTLGTAGVRLFPALKRGLGYAHSCSVVEIAVDS